MIPGSGPARRAQALHASLLTRRWREADSNPWSRYMADAFETILVAWLAFAFLPERPTRSQGGTDGSNPLSSSGESVSRVPSMVAGCKGPAFAGSVSLDETREWDVLATSRLAFSSF